MTSDGQCAAPSSYGGTFLLYMCIHRDVCVCVCVCVLPSRIRQARARKSNPLAACLLRISSETLKNAKHHGILHVYHNPSALSSLLIFCCRPCADSCPDGHDYSELCPEGVLCCLVVRFIWKFPVNRLACRWRRLLRGTWGF